MRSALLALIALVATPVAAWAQDDTQLPPGHPPIGDDAGGEGAGDEGHEPQENPHAGMGGRRLPGMGGQETFDKVEAASDLPRGTLVVRVVDGENHPVAGARVEVGMLEEGTRDRKVGTTRENGEVRWNGLETGPRRAYRVIVTNGPARYPAEPFQMTGDTGWRATVTRWPVTESTRTLLLFVMRTFLEFAEEGDRLKVTQHLQLMNVGQEAIAPDDGIPVPVPQGMKAFRTEQGMGDQRMVERDGKLFIEGSIPPGEVQLAYGFDLPMSGREFTYEQPIPFRLVMAEAYVEKAPGMKVTIPRMNEPQEVELDGRTFFGARIARRPDSDPFTKLRIQMRGLPGPGPGRWIALGLGVLVMGLGLASFLSGGDRRQAEGAALAAEKERLLEEAVRIAAQHAKGKLDESLYERVRERNLTRLAEVLRMEDRG